jgi:putative transposase
MGTNQGDRDHRGARDARSYSPVPVAPKYSVANVIGLLKGKSASEVMSFGTKNSRMVRGRTFWARGYCVSTVGLDEEAVREYIRNQEQIDRLQEEP